MVKLKKEEVIVSQIQTHDKCKSFSYKKCPHANDEIMQRATQETPQYYGGEPEQMLPFPTDDEINKICSQCDAFNPK